MFWCPCYDDCIYGNVSSWYCLEFSLIFFCVLRLLRTHSRSDKWAECTRVLTCPSHNQQPFLSVFHTHWVAQWWQFAMCSWNSTDDINGEWQGGSSNMKGVNARRKRPLTKHRTTIEPHGPIPSRQWCDEGKITIYHFAADERANRNLQRWPDSQQRSEEEEKLLSSVLLKGLLCSLGGLSLSVVTDLTVLHCINTTYKNNPVRHYLIILMDKWCTAC